MAKKVQKKSTKKTTGFGKYIKWFWLLIFISYYFVLRYLLF